MTDKLVEAAVSAPVNNLIVLFGLLGMVALIGGGYFGWRLFKYISNENSPLVKALLGIRDAFVGLKTTQIEKSNEVLAATKEQTGVLKDQTIVLQDFTNFQKTNNDHIADLGDKVESLEMNTDRRVRALEEKVEGLNTTIQGLPKCEEFTKQLEDWKAEIITAFKEQAKRETSTNVNVTFDPAAPTSNVLPDSDASAAAGEAVTLPKAS